jgi:hypothetical protein
MPLALSGIFLLPDQKMQTDQTSIASHGDHTTHATGSRTEAGNIGEGNQVRFVAMPPIPRRTDH